MKSKEYIRARHNDWRSWRDFDKITDKLQGKTQKEIDEIENSKEFKKALSRWQKWNEIFKKIM